MDATAEYRERLTGKRDAMDNRDDPAIPMAIWANRRNRRRTNTSNISSSIGSIYR